MAQTERDVHLQNNHMPCTMLTNEALLGAVRFVQADAVRQQLELGHVVLLSSLAYSAAGEVLNCNSYDVATHAAIELGADKFICVLDGLPDMQLPQWLPLGDAEKLIGDRAQVRPGALILQRERTPPRGHLGTEEKTVTKIQRRKC